MNQLPLKVRQATERIIQDLIADPDFAEHVAQKEIDKQVDSGKLVPTDKLTIAPGLTLVNPELLENMRNAITDVTMFLNREPPEVDKALTVLNTLKPPEPEDIPETGEQTSTTHEPESEQENSVPEPEAPQGFPEEGKTHRCVKCYKEVPQDFAEMMFIRWREIRCEDHAK